MDYESGEEPFAFPINLNGERACEDNIVAVTINGTATRMLVDFGAQSTVLGERQFHNLVRSGLRAGLQPKRGIFVFMAMGLSRLSVNLRLLSSVMGRKC